MSHNPYQPPAPEVRVFGVNSGRREDLRSVAIFQKAINVCILIYLIAVFSQFAIPWELRPILLVTVAAVILTGAVFVVLLALKVYPTAMGILLSILALVPLLGLLSLAIVNGKATQILRRNGIRVGLLGARMSQF